LPIPVNYLSIKIIKMKPKFEIGIPTLNRADLLLPSLYFYLHDFPDTRIVIVDNGKQSISAPLARYVGKHFGEPKPVFIAESDSNIGVAASWNFILRDIFKTPGNEYAVILNDDIYWGREQVDFQLFLNEFKRTFIQQPGIEKGFILVPKESKYDWSIFVISRAAWETIGEFDRNFFPAYFEDCDYKYRAKLAGVQIFEILGAPARFVSSGTIQKDKTLLANAGKNREYYIAKWGGEPGKEVFTAPFNEVED